MRRGEFFKQQRFGKELCHKTSAMNFIRDLDEVKQRGRKGAYRDILRPANLGQMRKVAGVGGFDVLSNSALNRQEELVLAHKLPFRSGRLGR